MDEPLGLSRQWVKDNYQHNGEHLLKAEQWLRRLNPGASEAMLLAALMHDMERAFPGPDSPKQDPSLGPDDPIYNNAHSARSARIVSEFLREHHISENLITAVAKLINVHEFGGWPEVDWVQAADSLSFLEVNVDMFLSWGNTSREGWSFENIRAKFDWMYNRIKIEKARIQAEPFYKLAMEKLRIKIEER